MTSSKSILLVGCPDSGKSNYVGRLWGSLKNHRGGLERIGMPANIQYVESICDHLLQGEFCGRTDKGQGRQDLRIALRPRTHPNQDPTELVVPDFTGELWLEAVNYSEISPDWFDAIKSADGALLFVRAHSDLNRQPWDWVTAREALQSQVGKTNRNDALPTQVVLCELLRLLRDYLGKASAAHSRPRVAVIVSAWDRLDAPQRQAGPMAFLQKEFPLFYGALNDTEELEVSAYGMSIVGGDLGLDKDFQKKFLSTMRLADAGSVTLLRDGHWAEDADISAPIAWVIGS